MGKRVQIVTFYAAVYDHPEKTVYDYCRSGTSSRLRSLAGHCTYRIDRSLHLLDRPVAALAESTGKTVYVVFVFHEAGDMRSETGI